VDVFSSNVKLTACADSLAYLGPFCADLAKLVPSKEPINNVKSLVSLDESINVFASIDEDAFNRIPELISGADLIEDDLPTNLDYLDHATRHSEVNADRATGETLRSWQTTEGDVDSRLNSEVNGETIKVLYHEPFEMEEDYWDTLPPTSRGYSDE
jgi:autophagy-related protein 2